MYHLHPLNSFLFPPLLTNFMNKLRKCKGLLIFGDGLSLPEGISDVIQAILSFVG